MLRDGPALAILYRDGETGPVTRFGGRPENSTADPLRSATLIVCLLVVNTPQDVTRNFRSFRLC